MNKIVVMVSGKARSGKDHLTNRLIEKFEKDGIKAVNLKFATGLKDMCRDSLKPATSLINSTIDSVWTKLLAMPNLNPTKAKEIQDLLGTIQITDENWYEDKTDLSRILLQTIGTEVCRSIDNDVWGKKALEETLKVDADVVIFSDMRFVGEWNYFEDECPDEIQNLVSVNIERGLKTTESGVVGHQSENDLIGFKFMYEISNTSTLEDYNANIDAFYEDIIEEM